MTPRAATPLERCGCGGSASEILPYGPFERDADGNKIDLGDFIECKKCGISVYRAAIGWVSIEERHRQLRDAWNRAMTRAPSSPLVGELDEGGDQPAGIISDTLRDETAETDLVGELREALEKVRQMLTIPAAEYVPAIGDCFRVIESAIARAKEKP